MTARMLPFVPPAPVVYSQDLPLWRLLWNVAHSNLAIWPEHVFEVPTVRRRVMGIEALLVNDPEAIRHILTTNAANYRQLAGFRRVARELGGAGLLAAEGEDWRRQRRLLAPTFAPANISLLLPHFRAAAVQWLASFEPSATVDLAQAFQQTAAEAMLRALFSMPDRTARERLTRLLRDYIEGPGRPTLLDGVAKRDDAFGILDLRRRHFHKAWCCVLDGIIADRKSQAASMDRRDLLDLLSTIKDADSGAALSNTEIRDQCASLFLAGSETTARWLFWATYLLTLDVSEQSRLRAEINGFPPERIRNLGDLHRWPRLRNVLLETLRLYPPLPHILRRSVAADVVGGEKIGANTQLWISPWVMHRHRKFWPQPTAFMPDRFACKAASWTQMPAFIPFGAGPRTCIGLSLALAEAQIILASLLQRYQISLPDSRPVLPIGRTTIEPSHQPLFRLQKA
jgi:cytochrome P450